MNRKFFQLDDSTKRVLRGLKVCPSRRRDLLGVRVRLMLSGKMEVLVRVTGSEEVK